MKCRTLALSFILQLFPNILAHRALFESRERSAKTYSWPAFIVSNILVDIPWNTLMAIIVFLCWYYPMGMYRNSLSIKMMLERNGVMILLIWVYLIYASTFGYMIQIGLESIEIAGIVSTTALFLLFCCIISTSKAATLPQVWNIVGYLSLLTYLVDGMLSVGLADVSVTCSPNEFLRFEPVTGSSCGSYMASYLQQVGGYLSNPSSRSSCLYCPIKDSNEFLAGKGMSYGNRWRNFCILWVYVGFNVVITFGVYWVARVPNGGRGMGKGVEGEGREEVGSGSGNGSGRVVSERVVGGAGFGGRSQERSFVKVRGLRRRVRGRGGMVLVQVGVGVEGSGARGIRVKVRVGMRLNLLRCRRGIWVMNGQSMG